MEKIESISESHLKRPKINEEFYNVNGQKDDHNYVSPP